MLPTRAIEIAAWSAGALMLATYGGVRTWSAYASNEGLTAMRGARASLSFAQPNTSSWSPTRLAEYRSNVASGLTPEAVLRIPKLRLEVPVYEGTSDLTLNRGAGRIEGTATVASDAGNIGIAGHRDGFFRPLKNIGVGDELLLETLTATRRYRVTRIDIVMPDDVSVLNATPASTVTLVTCYPFYFVGSAPKRFIVRAEFY